MQVMAVTSEMRIPVLSFNSKTLKNGNSEILIQCQIAGSEQLALMLAKLRKIPLVISADRVIN